MLSVRGSISRLTSGSSSGTAALEYIAPAKPVRIVELSVYLAAATASAYSLGRPAAAGITPTSPVNLLNEAGQESTVLGSTALAWGTGPTVPAQFFRQVSFPATIGSYAIWLFPRGLYVPANGTLVLWNSAANGIAYVNIIAEMAELF